MVLMQLLTTAADVHAVYITIAKFLNSTFSSANDKDDPRFSVLGN